MYAIEFETDVKDNYIKIPDYEKFAFQHVKVVVNEMAEPEVIKQVGAKQKTLAPFFNLAGHIDIDKKAINSLREESLI